MWLAPQMSRRSGRFPNDGGYDGSGWAGAIAAKQNLPSGQFGLEGGLGPPPNPNPVQHQVRVGDWDPGHMASMIKPDRRAKPMMGIVAGPFGKSLRQENPYRPSPPRRGPGGFGGGGFGGGSQGIDQFMDFMQQMMDMFKQFNSQGGGGYGQRRGPGGFPQPPQRYGQYQPQPARIMTQGPESLMGQIRTRGPESLNAQLRPHEGVYPGAPQTMTAMPYNPIWEHRGPGEATLQMVRPT